jgi:NDP-sugar pyrophosphorylase family protein
MAKTANTTIKQAIILAGGFGTRLGYVTKDTPKPILPVAGEPFLRYLLWILAEQGIEKVVISAGYKADAIKSALSDCSNCSLEISFVVEDIPLGTGGGARLAARCLDDGPFFFLKGETNFDAPIAEQAAL